MADWSLPITTTLYTSVLSILDARLDEVATMFDGAVPTNLPTGTFRINGTSNNILQRWGGAAWANQALAVQTLRIGQDGVNSALTITDLFLGADANIAAQGHLSFFIDSNNDQTDRAFKWYKNAAAVTGAALLMQLTEAGLLTGLVSVTATSFIGKVTINANLTGHVTSVDNASTLAVAAITGQTNTNTLTGIDEFVVSDGGVIRRVDMNRFIVGQATALTTGLLGTDEVLVSDGGVIKRMDISVFNAYFNVNLALNANRITAGTLLAARIPTHTGDVTGQTVLAIAAGVVGRTEIANSTTTSAGSIGTGLSVNIALNDWALFPMIHSSQNTTTRLHTHSVDGTSASNPRFGLVNAAAGTSNWDVDHRWIIAA
jgi:hypothetical protein